MNYSIISFRGEADNPVGELQELVTYLGWRRPEYDEEDESGPPHDRQFTIKIKVGKFDEQGRCCECVISYM